MDELAFRVSSRAIATEAVLRYMLIHQAMLTPKPRQEAAMIYGDVLALRHDPENRLLEHVNRNLEEFGKSVVMGVQLAIKTGEL